MLIFDYVQGITVVTRWEKGIKKIGKLRWQLLWIAPKCNFVCFFLTSTEFQEYEYGEGHKVYPSWCLVVRTAYFAPAAWNISIHSVALKNSNLVKKERIKAVTSQKIRIDGLSSNHCKIVRKTLQSIKILNFFRFFLKTS